VCVFQQRINRFVVCHFYIPDFLPSSSLHSIWQLSEFVLLPSCQGVIWSASISYISKCSRQIAQVHRYLSIFNFILHCIKIYGFIIIPIHQFDMIFFRFFCLNLISYNIIHKSIFSPKKINGYEAFAVKKDLTELKTSGFQVN